MNKLETNGQLYLTNCQAGINETI